MKDRKNNRYFAIGSILACCFFLSVFLSFNVNAGPGQSSPTGSDVPHNYGVKTHTFTTSNISVNEESRQGSKIEIEAAPSTNSADFTFCSDPDVSCGAIVANTVEAEFECDGSGTNGSWGTPSFPGATGSACWSKMEVCYYPGTANESCVDLVDDNSDLLDASQSYNLNITVDSRCGKSGLGEACAESEFGEFYVNSEGAAGAPDDKMFSIGQNSAGFLEYPALGSVGDQKRLLYIQRNASGKNRLMMIPSGPDASSPTAPTDFLRFYDEKTNMAAVEPACYPIDVDLCTGDFSPTDIDIDGVCDNTSTNETTPYACSTGVSNAGAYADTATDYQWQCDGINGGADSPMCTYPKPIDGECAALADYQTPQPANAGNGCNAGVYADAADNSTSWLWTCQGQYGGSDDSCAALKPTTEDAVCKTLAGTYSSHPATTAAAGCDVGTYESRPDTAASWNWRCKGTGIPAGSDADCSADKLNCSPAPTGSAENGTCGDAHGDSLADASAVNAAGRCLTGTATTVVLSGSTFSWNCNGTGGGTNQSCSATQSGPACLAGPTGSNENGTCGDAHGGSFTSASAVNSAGRCGAGSATSVSQSGSTYTWSCNGAGSGSDQNCSASYTAAPVNGVCKSISGNHTTQPATNSSNGCDAGTFNDITDSSYVWRWSCYGQNGGVNSGVCSATRVTSVNGVCKSISGTHPNEPAKSSSSACDAGTFTDLSDTSSQWRWRCDGQNGGSNSGTCTANRATAVNGSCGSAHGTTVSSAPSEAASCSSGTLTNQNASSTTYSWTCQGQNGGTNANCSASIAPSCPPSNSCAWCYSACAATFDPNCATICQPPMCCN